MLQEFEIESKIVAGYGFKRNVYAIVIKDIKKFFYEIGFNLKRKQAKLINLIR